MSDTFLLIHDGEFESCSNNSHLNRKIYPLVIPSVCALERPQTGYIHGLVRLNRGSWANCVCLPIWRVPVIACEYGRSQRVMGRKLIRRDIEVPGQPHRLGFIYVVSLLMCVSKYVATASARTNDVLLS